VDFLPLGVTVDEWNGFSNDEMLETIEKARKPIEIKKPVIQPKPEVKKPIVKPEPEPEYDDDEYFEYEDYDEKPRKKGQKNKLLIPIIIGGVAVVAAVVVLLVFVLGSASGPAKEAMNLINSIGEVTEESGEAIIEAEKFYATLSEGQKDEVDNYKVLVDAREAFDKIQAEKNAAQVESQLNQKISSISNAKVKKQSDIDEIMNMYNSLPADKQSAFSSKISEVEALTKYEEVAVVAINAFKSKLKDSGSLVVHSISVATGTSKALSPYYVHIDYSANNSFGGTIDEIETIDVTDAMKAGWWDMAMVFGEQNKGQTELQIYNDYLNNSTDKTDLDVDRIMNNL
jgi:uncharacterized surface protein with fasciclin (FAS1) repeats